MAGRLYEELVERPVHEQTAILTTVGVLIDAALIAVAPIALAIAKRTGLSKTAILVAMIGGGKAGNRMSSNPNAIAASDAYHIPLTSMMMAGMADEFALLLTFWRENYENCHCS